MYWKEYFPLKSTFEKSIFFARSIKYSLTNEELRTKISEENQPNSGESIVEFSILIFLHSLNALIPFKKEEEMIMFFVYHKAARVFLVRVVLLILILFTCQKGYLKSQKQDSISIFLDSLNALSPSSFPWNLQLISFIFLFLFFPD